MFTLTTLPQAKCYIFANTTNIFHNARGITCFSNYVLHKKNASTLCQTESLESKQGAPKQKKFLFVYFFSHKHYHFVPQNHNLEFFFFTVEAPFGLRLFKMDGCGVTGFFSPAISKMQILHQNVCFNN